jgi:P-type Ca2+ transporter type 2C
MQKNPAAANPPASTSTPWHSIGMAEALERVQSKRSGLDREEAARRLGVCGRNELPQAPAPTLPGIFLRQFKSPLIYILLVAALVAVAIGDLSDALFVGIVLLVNALIGGYQEWSAEKSSRALQQLLQIRASVLRDGDALDLDALEVVPGDIVFLESGIRVPADMRLLEAHGLEVDESLLTGESLAVHKDPHWSGPSAAVVGDRCNMAFGGSIVIRGRGVGVVVETGTRTVVGQLAVSVMDATGGRSPLMERLERFSQLVAGSVLVAAVLVGVFGVLVHQHSVSDMVMYGIALAVSAIPEGLPITITVALAIATRRMARRGLVVRRLAAVEGLGSCTLIASDKTGTLTCNELTVRSVRLADGTQLEVTGEGFAPEGEVLNQGEAVDAGFAPELAPLLDVAVLCNEADLYRRDGAWSWRGDPTDVALLSLAHKLGRNRPAALLEHPPVTEIPFEAEHQFAANFNRTPQGVRVHVKGAPERVLEMCAEHAGGTTRAGHLEVARSMAEQGYRVLALATGPAPADLDAADVPPAPAELTFIGFVGMIDPLRPGVREAVAACHGAGVAVSMITGDHPLTALAIARDLGLVSGDEAAGGAAVVTGRELESMSPAQLAELVQRVRVFARVAPRQKLELVEAARAAGHYVAVTGDGVNDAPALRSANIGVAMGKSGTDVAREAAELVVSDDNFTTIVAGIEEGRVAYDNIRKVVFLLVSTGAAEVLLLSLAVIMGAPLPLLPAQILWLNLVTSGLQDKPLALEPPEGNVLARPPRPPSEPIFNRLMIERTLVVASVMAVVGYIAFEWALAHAPAGVEPEPYARNSLLLFLVLAKTFHLAASRSETSFALELSPMKSPVLVACAAAALLIHVLAMYLPWTQSVLRLQPVDGFSFAFLATAGLTVFVAMELHKWTWRLRHPPTGPARSRA